MRRRIPQFVVNRYVALDEVAKLRGQAARRISWTVLFLKAYAIVAAECRPLRQAHVAWPWPHLLEMPHSVAMVAINRWDDVRQEDRLCWGRFLRPEEQSLAALQQALEFYQTGPLDEAFRRQMLLNRFPTPLRRLLWWINRNLVVKNRARRIGTFGMSTLAGQGAWNRSHPTIHATSLTYGPLDAERRMLVSLICDHRVLDGALAARALAELEAAFAGPIREELAQLANGRAAA